MEQMTEEGENLMVLSIFGVFMPNLFLVLVLPVTHAKELLHTHVLTFPLGHR